MTNDPMHQCTEVQSAEPQPLHKARRCGARTRSGRPIDAPWPFEVRSETDKAKSPEAHDQTREFPPSRAGLISALGQASLRPTKQKPPGGLVVMPSRWHVRRALTPLLAVRWVRPHAWFSAHPSCTPSCTPCTLAAIANDRAEDRA